MSTSHQSEVVGQNQSESNRSPQLRLIQRDSDIDVPEGFDESRFLVPSVSRASAAATVRVRGDKTVYLVVITLMFVCIVTLVYYFVVPAYLERWGGDLCYIPPMIECGNKMTMPADYDWSSERVCAVCSGCSNSYADGNWVCGSTAARAFYMGCDEMLTACCSHPALTEAYVTRSHSRVDESHN